MKSRKGYLNYFIVMLFLTVIVIQYYNKNFNLEIISLVYFSGIAFMPLLLFILGQKEDLLEIDVIAFSYMGIGFILRYISLKIDPNINSILTSNSMIRGILYQAIMCTTFYIGYLIIRRKFWGGINYKESDISNNNKLIILVYIIIIFSRLYLIITNNVIVYDFNQEAISNIIVNYCKTISSLGAVVCGLLLFKYIVKKSIKIRVIFILVLIEVIWALLIGAKTSLIELIVMLALGRLYGEKKRIKLKQFLILIVMVIFTFITINNIRNAYKSLDSENKNIKSIISNIINPNNSEKDALDIIMPIISRSDILDSISLIIEKTPSVYPYLNGEQYMYMPFIPIIPGSLWENKPEYKDGLYNAWYYREKPKNVYTHYAAGITGGFYWNFGLIGTCIAMFLIGMLYSYFYCWFLRKGIKKDLTFILYGSIFTKIILMEVTFYNIYLNCFQIVVVCTGILIIYKIFKKVRF